MNSNHIKTTIKQICDYWSNNSSVLNECHLNFDWSDCYTNCWNCGDDKETNYNKNGTRLQRCHIVPRMLGGKDIPSNYVLLCARCHSEAPNTTNSNDMWDWIKSNYMPFSIYGTYRARKALLMFENREGYSFINKLVELGYSDFDEFKNILNTELQKVGMHEFYITEISYYYVFKSIIKIIEEKMVA